MSKLANLRVCASCEWIFVRGTKPEFVSLPQGSCPKCGFAHYGARYVYGDRAYRYAVTQKPWFDKRMAALAVQLHAEIAASQ